jgi:hypothetical protein
VLTLYFGSGDGHASLMRRPLKLARRLVLGRKGETARKASIERRAPGGLRGPRAVWALTLAQEKRAKLRRAERGRSNGTLVVCDRYPQAQVPGCIDGPLLSEWRTSPNRVKRRLAMREARAYEAAEASPPDLVLRLRVDDAALLERRPGHDEADLLRRRHVVESLRFGAGTTATVEIDTGRPLVDVIADARRAIDQLVHTTGTTR